ncbi:hypothetical protein IAU60_004154 [Kwoniella sp. DSM 27419]
MSSRSRAKRVTAPQPAVAGPSSTPRSRPSRGRKSEPDPDLEEDLDEDQDESMGIAGALALGDEGEDAEEDAEGSEDEEIPQRGRSSKARTKGRTGTKAKGAAGRSRRRGQAAELDEEDNEDALGETDAEGEDEDMEEDVKPSRRSRKSVSYKEIPVDSVEVDVEDAEEEEDEDGEGELEEDEEEPGQRRRLPPVRLNSQTSSATPRRRARASLKPDEGSDEDRTDTPYKKEKIPGGSGRGGFSVKGAAAAAARARWDKVRREKIERGEDPDEPRSARKPKRRVVLPDPDEAKMDSTVTVKGVDYTVGDDELIIPDDPKGDTKVNAEGSLLGGREYKMVTFKSEGRRNPERLYAMTIDAARACGYTDSLAFLRRCPQILKLSCTAEERQQLIDIGRIAGNLKHRQVTMVAVRNVYKLMGARVVKGGKWVTDDYYEDESLAKCAENGFEPYTIAEDEEIAQNAAAALAGPSKSQQADAPRSAYNLTPLYVLGGPTTTFAGTGIDPWTDAGHGHRRSRLRASGVTEEDWMLRYAEESRAIDQQLKGYREERLTVLEGVDGARGWVYSAEQNTEEVPTPTGVVADAMASEDMSKPTLPVLERKPSALSRDVTREMTQLTDEALTPLPVESVDDVDMEEGRGRQRQRSGPEIIIEDSAHAASRKSWSLGLWQQGVVKAAYEPHTQMPHVPQFTQPTTGDFARYAPYPVLSSSSDSKHNFVQATVTGPAAKGLASVEFVFESGAEDEVAKRMREVEEAVEWEKEVKRRRK